ncbi:acyltransferase [Flavobacterium enshiense]|uniref:acyltransferase n=1 Tax=Flavobacterium enshiense TaxID=1341165 RepID=UPI00345D6AF1
MVKNFFQSLLNKAGKSYQIDTAIPDSLIVRTLWCRFVMMLRGLIKLQRKTFLGSNVSIYNKKNFFFGRNVTIEQYTHLDGYASRKIKLGNNCKIGAFSKLTCTSHLSKYGIGLTMGDNSAIGDYTHFGASGGIEIGSDVIMGSYISFHSENHVFSNPDQLIREQGVTSKGIKIGNNVWVGAKVTFLDGSEVGNNTVVAAGAVVSGAFPDNVVIGGVPAKIIKTIETKEK